MHRQVRLFAAAQSGPPPHSGESVGIMEKTGLVPDHATLCIDLPVDCWAAERGVEPQCGSNRQPLPFCSLLVRPGKDFDLLRGGASMRTILRLSTGLSRAHKTRNSATGMAASTVGT